MKILITGSEGFIGKHLAAKLKDEGHEVFGFDIKNGQDMLNDYLMERAIKKVDAVCHLAAQADLYVFDKKPEEGMDLNIKATEIMSRHCTKYNKWLIYISTGCVYGNQKSETTEETLPNPAEIYACSKLAGEYVIKGYGLNYGLNWTILRLPTTHGSGMRDALGIAIFFKQAITGEPITIHGDGCQTRNLTHVFDVVDAISLVVKNKEKTVREIFNICSEEAISANKMAEDIKTLTGSQSEIIHIEQRKGQVIEEKIKSKKILDTLDWKPKVNWEDGLKETYNWIKQ